MEEEQQQVFEKAEIVESTADSIQDLFFRIRGYYAFQIEDELNGAYQAIQDIHSNIRQFKSYTLDADEQKMVDEIEGFLATYEHETLPKAVQFVKVNDYDGLRDLARSGAIMSVNRFISFANDYDVKVKEQVSQAYDKTKKQTNQYFLVITLLGLAFLLIPVFMVWNVMNRVVRPVEKITYAADQYETEGKILFQPLPDKDEIGVLSQAIHKMMERIQTNEQELLAQNEELITQQDELFNRQTKMEYALSEARFSRVRLERYNGLSHLLSFSLDKQEVINQTSGYLDEIYQADVSVLWLPKSDVHSFKGITKPFFEEFKSDRFAYLKFRLESEPYFVIKREADYEKGIADRTTYVYDFVTGIYNSADELSVVSVLSRIGKPFTEDDQADLYGLLKRIAIAVDRIEQYELISHERQLNQNILDNINEGIRFVSNLDEDDQYNRALFNLLQMEPTVDGSDWPREKWTDAFLQKIDEPERYASFLDEALGKENKELIQNTYTLKLSGGSSRVMNVYSVPIVLNDEKVGTIFVHRDITHEHEVDQMKTELVSTVSHELRTPLSSILGFSELLLNKEMDDKRKKRYLDTIHSEASRLTVLINDFLDIQRMESGRQTYKEEEVRLADLADQTVKQLAVQSSSHEIRMQDNTCSSTIIADRDRMIQVFTNLLSNAVKFSPDGGEVKVTLWNEEDSVIVSISDEGIGIPQADIGHLFEKFYRFDNSFSRKIGGTGLGLSICQEIIKDHNGKIWVDSVENEGTTVFFSLPLKQQLPVQSVNPDKPLVMIVEDDVNIALLIGEELEYHGFSVIHLSTVEKAFECAQQMQPAAIVIDLLLGEDENGWKLVNLLKEEEKTAFIPIIISSSMEQEAHLTEAFKIEHYFTKPYPLHNLSETIIQNIDRADGRILYPDPE